MDFLFFYFCTENVRCSVHLLMETCKDKKGVLLQTTATHLALQSISKALSIMLIDPLFLK